MKQDEIEYALKEIKAFRSIVSNIELSKNMDHIHTCEYLIENYKNLYPNEKESIAFLDEYCIQRKNSLSIN